MPVWEDVHSGRIPCDIVHTIAQNEVSVLTPWVDLSPRTRVYIPGGCWVSHLFGFWPVWSGTCLQIPIKRSLDLPQLMCWLSYTVMTCGASAICLDLMSVRIFEQICEILVVPFCHCLYISDKQFSESRLLAIIGSSWPMTLAPQMKLSVMKQVKKDLNRQGNKIDRLDGISLIGLIGVRIDFYQKALDCWEWEIDELMKFY